MTGNWEITYYEIANWYGWMAIWANQAMEIS